MSGIGDVSIAELIAQFEDAVSKSSMGYGLNTETAVESARQALLERYATLEALAKQGR